MKDLGWKSWIGYFCKIINQVGLIWLGKFINSIGVFEGVLLREFMQFIGNNSDPKVKARLDEISSLCDLRYPHEWYSSARSLNRFVSLTQGKELR